MIDLNPACEAMIKVLADVGDDRLTTPSPCTEFTVGDLIDHVDLVAQGATALALGSSERPATGYSYLSNSTWGKIALTELVVHGWDIATATGQGFDLPEQTLQACFEHVAVFVPNAPLPDLWGPPVEVPPDAALLDRILAITGRAP